MSQCTRLSALICLILFFSVQPICADSMPPEIPLAQTYKQGTDLQAYWLSEKFDGVRAYWDGKQLLSRRGNVYHAPDWFIADFPAYPLDGELWIARQRFEQLVSVVRDKIPTDDWREVHYLVFDLPIKDVIFTKRIERLKTLFVENDSPYLRFVEQSRISTHDALISKLENLVKAGGEGLMLHRGDSYYRAGRSRDLLKVKSFQDAEATVIGHLPGKGKYTGMLGALLVETKNKKRFRLGSGFSDKQRQQPPAIGAIVTYKYYGKTVKGLPRFASFLRVRSM